MEVNIDEFCHRIDQELESPARESQEMERAAFVKEEMEKKHFQGDGCLEKAEDDFLHFVIERPDLKVAQEKGLQRIDNIKELMLRDPVRKEEVFLAGEGQFPEIECDICHNKYANDSGVIIQRHEGGPYKGKMVCMHCAQEARAAE